MKFARKIILSIKSLLYRIANLSSAQYRILRYFFLMTKTCIDNPERMHCIQPGISRIAEKSNCNESTVQRFLREFKDLVQVEYRHFQTSKYKLSKDCYEALRFLNCEGKLDCSKRWVNIWIRKLLSHYELCAENATPTCAENATLSLISFKERVPLEKEESGFVYDPFISLKDRFSIRFCEEIAKLGWYAGNSITQRIGNLKAKGQKIHDKTALGIALLPRHMKNLSSKMMRENLKLRCK